MDKCLTVNVCCDKVQLDLTRVDYRASLENRRIFREILEHGPEVYDPQKTFMSSSHRHQQHEQGRDLPESQ